MDYLWCKNVQEKYEKDRKKEENEIKELCKKLIFLSPKMYEAVNNVSDITNLSILFKIFDVYEYTPEQKELCILTKQKVSTFLKRYGSQKVNFFNLADSKPKEYIGDIIITDPCYIMKDDDWHKFCDGELELEEIIPSIIYRDTLYGDWSCSTFSNNKNIGEFCADAGMVCVATLEDILKYNPNFNYHKEKPWTTTLIKNFKGHIQFKVFYYNQNKVLTDDFYKNRNFDWYDFEVQVVGEGINMITRENFNFFTTQIGL